MQAMRSRGLYLLLTSGNSTAHSKAAPRRKPSFRAPAFHGCTVDSITDNQTSLRQLSRGVKHNTMLRPRLAVGACNIANDDCIMSVSQLCALIYSVFVDESSRCSGSVGPHVWAFLDALSWVCLSA